MNLNWLCKKLGHRYIHQLHGYGYKGHILGEHAWCKWCKLPVTTVTKKDKVKLVFR